MTTSQGVPITDNQNSEAAGERGPVLLQDIRFIEKIANFYRERIPERVVHAKGAGAHGYFQVYRSMEAYTKAKFLQHPKKKTPVFVRFLAVTGGEVRYGLCVQLMDIADELKQDFDPLGATKIWPEEKFPLMPVGKMVLARNPENYFSEVEQAAFCPAAIVPGIDF